MMTRRTHNRDIFMLIGGVHAFNQWQSIPVVRYQQGDFIAEEPYWWVLPDGNLMALFRDNARGGYLYRAFSTDNGRTWSRPVQTNFPDARSKFNGLQLSDGRFILVSNPNPQKRDPLALSVSQDGMVFRRMGYLIGGRRVDYPHVIEHQGHLLIAFSGAKQSVEVLKIKISVLDKLQMPDEPIRQ
jgi:predicted neuraminidase